MSIGEISTGVPAGDAGAVVAASGAGIVGAAAAGAASFADRLAAALGAAVGAVAGADAGGQVIASAGVGPVASVPAAPVLPDMLPVAAPKAALVAAPVALPAGAGVVPLVLTVVPEGPALPDAESFAPVLAPVLAAETADVSKPDGPVAQGDPVTVGLPAVMDAGSADADAIDGAIAVDDDAAEVSEEAAPVVAVVDGQAVGVVPAPVVVPVVVPVAVVTADPSGRDGAGEVSASAAVPSPKPALKGAVRSVTVSVVAGFDAAETPVGAVAPDVAATASPVAGKTGRDADQAAASPDLTAGAKPAKAQEQAAALPDIPPAVAAPVAGATSAADAVAGGAAVVADGAKGESAPKPAADPAGQVVAQTLPTSVPSERGVAPPLRTDLPGWEQVLTERIAADLSEDGQEIELSLNPEKLGPLRIKLDMTDGLATVRIITATPEAARVFTEAQHRLTEGLARAGIDLGSASAQSEGQGARQGGQPDDRAGPRGRMTEFLAHSRRNGAGEAPVPRRAGAGLVNLMA